MTFSGEDFELDFENAPELTEEELELIEGEPDPDQVYDRYKAKFGETFSWYSLRRGNDPQQIAKTVELMQSALMGDREEVTNEDLGVKEPSDIDILTNDW